MKIINVPSNKPWTREVECQKCSTEVEIEIDDFNRRIDDQRDGSAAEWTCPTCKSACWVDISLIPTYLHHRIPFR